MYIVDNTSNDLLYGEPLPKKLSLSNKGAHFMTVDKIVADYKMQDMYTQSSLYSDHI
jgi:hypothetical protein